MPRVQTGYKNDLNRNESLYLTLIRSLGSRLNNVKHAGAAEEVWGQGESEVTDM